MIDPLTTVLFRVFVKEFYKTHTGLLVFLFVNLISYCFFIQVLNEVRLTHEEAVKYHFIIVLNFISSPSLAIAVCIGWLFWTFKTWEFISKCLELPQNQFLFYSTTTNSFIKQLRSWFVVQLFLSLPALVYAVFAITAGLIVGQFLIPMLFMLYLLLVCCISAWVYVRWVNQPKRTRSKGFSSVFTVNWKKPFFSLFLYHTLDRLKIPLIVTKLLSYAVITGGSFLIKRSDELQFGGIIFLGVALAHSLLIYFSYQFEYNYLGVFRNLPRRKISIFGSWAITYLLLTLPENLWLINSFTPKVSSILLLFNVGVTMILRSILYTTILEMKRYIYLVFFIFLVQYFLILFGFTVLLAFFTLLLSLLIFESDYYKQKVYFKSQNRSDRP